MPTSSKSKVEFAEDEQKFKTVTVQKANDVRGHKITIPKEVIPFMGIEVGDTVSVRKMLVDGEPAILVKKVKP